MSKYKTRFQRRVLGIKRNPLYSSYLPKLEAAVERAARQFHCSKSLVIVTAVSDALGVDIFEQPLETKKRDLITLPVGPAELDKTHARNKKKRAEKHGKNRDRK